MQLDAAAISDTIGVLGGVLQVGQLVGGLRVTQQGGRFVIAARAGDEAAMARAAAGARRAGQFTRGAERLGEVLGWAELMWGNMVTLNEIIEINRLEQLGPGQGGITHAEARRRRAHLIVSAIRDNAMQLYEATRRPPASGEGAEGTDVGEGGWPGDEGGGPGGADEGVVPRGP